MFNRNGSTLSVMDDLQIAVHSYDGCARGCSGCLVDKTFKNKARFETIISLSDMAIINDRVKSYSDWCQATLNKKESGYFGVNGHKVNHHSYTFRFGNHAELSLEDLIGLAGSVETDYRVFSTGPTEGIENFAAMRDVVGGNVYLEIIDDPLIDSGESIKDMILKMRSMNILGYPEVLLTKRLIENLTPTEFVENHVSGFSDVGAQIQFGRYVPSATRGFSKTQMVDIDIEVEWLAEVSKKIVAHNFDLHPIPLGEYAVTFLDEYGEADAWKDGVVNQQLLSTDDEFDLKTVLEKVRDIFLTSLYIDHNLDVFVWAESMGQHVLDGNFGYSSLGNLRESSIEDMVSEENRNNSIDKMLLEIGRDLSGHPKCSGCRYKSFCASHMIPLFRKWQDDRDAKHCYGYLPVVREFQRSPAFLQNMIDGFKDLGF